MRQRLPDGDEADLPPSNRNYGEVVFPEQTNLSGRRTKRKDNRPTLYASSTPYIISLSGSRDDGPGRDNLTQIAALPS